MEIVNRRSYHDYFVLETYEVGIALSGTEVKSIRRGKANIRDAYAHIRNGEIYLVNMHISPYEEGNRFNHEETRTRKLLMHKKEINKLNSKLLEQGTTLVALKVYFVKNKVKILIGLCKGKKDYDKREVLKKKEAEIEMAKRFKLR